MSDDAKEEQATAAPAGDGFTPAPPPPALSAEEAAAATAAADASGAGHGDTILPDGTVAVPQDTAKRALEAVQILVENNRSASQQLESLMGIVLDAAEVANRSASAVATTGTHVNKAAEKLIDGAKKTGNQAKVVLALAAAVLVGTAGTFSFMTVQLHGKVEQLDEMLLAVGKRAVDLKRRMETMDDIHASLEELNLKQENTQSVQQAIEDKIARLMESGGVVPARKDKAATPAETPAKPETPPKSEKPAKAEQKAETKAEPKSERADKAEAPAKTNASPKTVSVKKPAKTDSDDAALLQQLTGLDALLKEQARAVKELSSQVNNLQGSVATVDVIKKDVESIAALQKQREKEAAQREKEAAQELAAANARREKEVKDKERELARERERAREREAAKERELAREREAAKERELARERELAKDREKNKDKDRAVSYNREQSKPNAAASVDGAPSYAKPASKTE
jgi:hypothetical protein